jgi:hypothetical protein
LEEHVTDLKYAYAHFRNDIEHSFIVEEKILRILGDHPNEV